MLGIKDKHGKLIESIGLHKSIGRLHSAYHKSHKSLKSQYFTLGLFKKHMDGYNRTIATFEVKESDDSIRD